MAFSRPSRDANGSFPQVPSILKAKTLDISKLRDVPKNPLRHVASSNKPYLSLRARLSQVWLNRWTVLLLLILVKTLLTLGSLHDNIGDAKEKALSACTKVEDIGSAMSSMPHYLSVGVNEMSASGIERAVDGMVTAMQLSLTVVETLILFIISMMTSTYVCLVTSLIHSGLDAAANVTKEVTDAMNKIIDSVADSISSGASSLQDTINHFADEIESSVFGKLLPDIPKVNFTSDLNKLKNIEVNSTEFLTDLNKLNENIPTFDQVKNATEEAISAPFDLIKNLIKNKYSDYKFERSVFPVAQKQQLSFCSDNNNLNSFFEGLYKIARDARIAFLIVLIILAIAATVPMAWMEIRRWRRDNDNAKLVGASQFDPLDVVYIASRPHSSVWGIKLASRFSGKNQIMVRWAWAYMTTMPALFVLSIAIAGFFACLCQLIILHFLQKQVPEISAQVGDFATNVVTTLKNSSAEWATGANGVITNFNHEINHDLLGWVSNGTTAVNNTLNTFTDAMESALEFAFNGTILKEPISDVVYCLIGLKVATVQKGLTWLHDQANVSLPQFPDDIFSLGANESLSKDSDLSSFLASPSSVTTDEISSAVEKVITKLKSAIVTEALISLGVFLCYIVIVLIGLLRAAVGMLTSDKTRGEGGGSFKFADDPPLYTPTDVYSPAGGGGAMSSSGAGNRRSDDIQMADLYTGATAFTTNEKVSMVRGGTGVVGQGHEGTSSYGEVGAGRN